MLTIAKTALALVFVLLPAKPVSADTAVSCAIPPTASVIPGNPNVIEGHIAFAPASGPRWSAKITLTRPQNISQVFEGVDVSTIEGRQVTDYTTAEFGLILKRDKIAPEKVASINRFLVRPGGDLVVATFLVYRDQAGRTLARGGMLGAFIFNCSK